MSVAKSRLPAVPALLALSLAAAAIVSFAADVAHSADLPSAHQSATDGFAAPGLTPSIVEIPAPQDVQVVVRVGSMDLGALGLETFGDLDDTPR